MYQKEVAVLTRTSLTLTKEIEDEILRLRRTKEHCDKSKAEIMRFLIIRGLNSNKAEKMKN